MDTYLMVLVYGVYLVVSIAITVWVGRTLHKNGRIFLVENFSGNEALADSINHLLLVGFYLINLGFISLTMKAQYTPQNIVQGMEFISGKIGLIIVILGVMHFTNMIVLVRFRHFRMGIAPTDPQTNPATKA